MGIQTGDQILAIDGANLAGVSVTNEQVFARLRGPQGSKVAMSVKRPGETRVLNFTLTRTRIPASSVDVAFMVDHRTGYLKVRDRASYEFALTSAAVVARVEDGVLAHVAIGLGGVGSVPWRATRAEEVLRGRPASLALFEEAAAAELADAFTLPGTDFKPELARRTLVRQLRDVTEVTA